MPKIKLILQLPSPADNKLIAEFFTEWPSIEQSPFKEEIWIPRTGDDCDMLKLTDEWSISFTSKTKLFREEDLFLIHAHVDSIKISGPNNVRRMCQTTLSRNPNVLEDFVSSLMKSNAVWIDCGHHFEHLHP